VLLINLVAKAFLESALDPGPLSTSQHREMVPWSFAAPQKREASWTAQAAWRLKGPAPGKLFTARDATIAHCKGCD